MTTTDLHIIHVIDNILEGQWVHWTLVGHGLSLLDVPPGQPPDVLGSDVVSDGGVVLRVGRVC